MAANWAACGAVFPAQKRVHVYKICFDRRRDTGEGRPMKKWKLIGFSVFLSSCSVYDRVPIGSSGSDKLFQDTPNVAASLGGAAEIAMWFVGAWIVFEVLRLGFRGFGIGNG